MQSRGAMAPRDRARFSREKSEMQSRGAIAPRDRARFSRHSGELEIQSPSILVSQSVRACVRAFFLTFVTDILVNDQREHLSRVWDLRCLSAHGSAAGRARSTARAACRQRCTCCRSMGTPRGRAALRVQVHRSARGGPMARSHSPRPRLRCCGASSAVGRLGSCMRGSARGREQTRSRGRKARTTAPFGLGQVALLR